MPANFKDYDALTAEKPEFIRHIGGRDIVPSKKLPARVALDAQRKARGNMTDNEALDFLLSFGESVLKEDWEHCLDHLELNELTDLVQDLLAYYGLRSEEVDEDPKEERPKVEGLPSMTSSRTGEPSILTSNAFGLQPAPASTQAN
jgi:hypothetical protein